MKSLRKIFIMAVAAVAILGGIAAWLFFGSNTGFSDSKKVVYIKTGSGFTDVLAIFDENGIIKNSGTFKWLAAKMKYTEKVKPGKYTIEKGASNYSMLKMLRSGNQTPVNLTILKIRTKEALIQKIAASFESDSSQVAAVFNNPDTLAKMGLDSNTLLTAIIPNTYSFLWTNSPVKILKKLYADQEKFWTEERKKKAASLNLTPKQVYTLASIVEEESNIDEDKGKIASVYLNRMEIGMKLGADPTVIFAVKDFTIKRVLNVHTQFQSPYNTYLYAGLPPGPICTPSVKSIDAVLNAPSTDYLFFVAQPNLTGYSNFATNYNQHMIYAKEYQQWLTGYLKAKATK